MNTSQAIAQKVTPAEVALMGRIVDDLVAGGTDLFLSVETQWRNSNLGQFMLSAHRAPKLSQHDLDADAVWAKFNRTGRR